MQIKSTHTFCLLVMGQARFTNSHIWPYIPISIYFPKRTLLPSRMLTEWVINPHVGRDLLLRASSIQISNSCIHSKKGIHARRVIRARGPMTVISGYLRSPPYILTLRDDTVIVHARQDPSIFMQHCILWLTPLMDPGAPPASDSSIATSIGMKSG